LSLLNVMFVDDDPSILQGLRRMLRPLRSEWNMLFAEGGRQAMELLAKQPIEVVVSDMRMPGVDGAALLEHVKTLYPHAVRIILSGESSKATSLRSVGLAHQFLFKPCEPKVLQEAVDRAYTLRRLLQCDELRRIVAQTESLPSPPALYLEILDELKNANASTKRVGEIIARDPSMSAKVLHMVNSSFFGISNKVSSPIHATALLGVETIKQLVLALHAFSQLNAERAAEFGVDRLWNRSFQTANLAQRIARAEKLDPAGIDDALAAGMLHDVGTIILIRHFPVEYGMVIECAKEQFTEVWKVERGFFAASHAEIGAYLLGLWGLPDTIVETAAYHHEPSKSGITTFRPLAAVHLAGALIDERERDPALSGGSELMDGEFLDRLGLRSRLPEWRKMSEEIVDSGAERVQ